MIKKPTQEISSIRNSIDFVYPHVRKRAGNSWVHLKDLLKAYWKALNRLERDQIKFYMEETRK